jgi:hypothetical protein
MLGVGLHSYGFMGRAFDWLALFILSQLLLIGDGLLAGPYWRSFQAQPSRAGTVIRMAALAANVLTLVIGLLFGYLWAVVLTGLFLGGVAVVGLHAMRATESQTEVVA